MTFKEVPAGESERNVALDGWVAAFDREMEQSGDIAASTAAVAAHGCFDVRAVVERWILTNPTAGAALAQVQPAPQEPTAPRLLKEAPAPVLVLEEIPVIVLEEAPPAVVSEVAPPVSDAGEERTPSADEELTSRRPAAESSPDIGVLPQLAGGRYRARTDRRGLPRVPARDRPGRGSVRVGSGADSQRSPPAADARGSQRRDPRHAAETPGIRDQGPAALALAQVTGAAERAAPPVAVRRRIVTKSRRTGTAIGVASASPPGWDHLDRFSWDGGSLAAERLCETQRGLGGGARASHQHARACGRLLTQWLTIRSRRSRIRSAAGSSNASPQARRRSAKPPAASASPSPRSPST